VGTRHIVPGLAERADHIEDFRVLVGGLADVGACGLELGAAALAPAFESPFPTAIVGDDFDPEISFEVEL